MKPTGFASLALVATAATLLSTADAHGKMTEPVSRGVSDKYHKNSGALINIGANELQIAPIEGLSQHKQADFPTSATFNLLNGCRGTVYEAANKVTPLAPGADFNVEWKIDAPHPGYMKLSILKPSEDSTGTITYKSYKTLLNIEPFAENGGGGSTTAKMPADVSGCEKPGDCVLQFYWHSDIANQTYPTCSDIVVSGSGGGTATSTSTTASTPTATNGGGNTPSKNTSNASLSTNASPSTTSARSTNAPSTNAPQSNSSPSTNASPSTNTYTSTSAPQTDSTARSSYNFNS